MAFSVSDCTEKTENADLNSELAVWPLSEIEFRAVSLALFGAKSVKHGHFENISGPFDLTQNQDESNNIYVTHTQKHSFITNYVP